jgi:localization factor PodJL
MIEASTPAHVTPPQTGSAVTGAASLPDVTGSLDQTQIMPPAQGSTGSSLPSPAWPAGSGDLPAVIGGSALRGAAADGDPAAAFEVAARYAEGRGVPMNLPEAVRWFAYAASHGLAPAQFRLGSLYEKGQGVKKDLNEARRLYLAAAEQGNAKAMHNLAVLYAEGIEGKPDYKIAAEWFLKASNRDVADSQYNLGILYARGIGIGQNLPEAYKWFTLAARKGDNDAAKKRDDVGGRLDPQALMAARLAVQTWVAEPQPEGAMIVKTPPGGWDTPPARVQPAKSKTRPKV